MQLELSPLLHGEHVKKKDERADQDGAILSNTNNGHVTNRVEMLSRIDLLCYPKLHADGIQAYSEYACSNQNLSTPIA